ncbi:methylated-DNA--[protein]-cysteine S-methyltransferase [Leucobacter coleopterorum]|uniref:methylated-DNA--[protein]-cysteine S-methyltransferase n=1 Tax=Leucobacter coleopterorum TaxID=2714933 RepID=UPI003137B145
MTRRHTRIATEIGELTLVADGDYLVGLYFPGHWYLPPADSYGPFVGATVDPIFKQAERELSEYFAGDRTQFDVPVQTSGDELSEQVWERLRAIPYGKTVTYGQIATELGNRHLAQRVGQAVGHNPVSIIVPCHRVVGSNGSLTGFAGDSSVSSGCSRLKSRPKPRPRDCFRGQDHGRTLW